MTRDLNVTPHIVQNTSTRISAIDARTTRHPGYAISQQKRNRTEKDFKFTLTMAAYDLIPAGQLAQFARMTSRRLSKNGPAKRDITKSLSPRARLGRHAPSATISAAC